MMKILLVFGLVAIFGAFAQEQKLKVSIYYETLCPDSIRFFRYQIEPQYKTLLPYVDFDFIPYGHATHRWENNKWNIQCQHGQKECVGNRFHACELAQGYGKEKDAAFVSCSMSYTNPTSFLRLRECCKNLDLDFDQIDDCFRNGTGHELLVQMGERTQALKPNLSYVPTIVFNDNYSQTIQDSSERNLFATICEYLGDKPSICSQ